MFKRIISTLLVFVFIVSMIPVLALAAESEGFLYSSNGNGITIDGYSGTNKNNVTIPSAINGKPVTNIHSIIGTTGTLYIPATVTKIDNNAFGDINTLTEFNVASDNCYYSSCGKMLLNKDQTILIMAPEASTDSTYTIPNTVQTIGCGAFKSNKFITNITLPDSVEIIESYAFYRCSTLSSIKLSKRLLDIGDNAFTFCNMESIMIPERVWTIGLYAFGGDDKSVSQKLSKIEVDPNSKQYTSVDGVLFRYGMCELVAYPPAKQGNYTIPDTVTNILVGAFCGCQGLTGISFPEGLSQIRSRCFTGCYNLTQDITFPSSIKSVGANSFENVGTINYRFLGNAPTAYSAGDQVHSFPNTAVIHYLKNKEGWTTPTWNGYKAEVFVSNQHEESTSSPSVVTATPNAMMLTIDGQAVSFDAYNINDRTYIKLRDLAYKLNGSRAQFDTKFIGIVNGISYNEICIISRPYTAIGGEMASKGLVTKNAVKNSMAVIVDGSPSNLIAYNIDGNTYFSIRELGKRLDFYVDWDNATKTIIVDTTKRYSW